MSYVYCYVTVPDITDMKARITDAFATVTEDMLENTWREIEYRLDVLRATKGAHVEVYFLFCGAATQRGSWPPRSRGF